ncbi:MAG TPA: hypothetical protein VGS80_25875 [Ktedonobacterales bacterium]|nr:hypothetical protein [Ktedonobacterales bacterium]
MRAISAVMAMALGLVGAVIGFVVNALYSLVHVLGRISGITADRSHFFIGTGLAIVAVVGALCVAGAPEVGAILLVLATIGFFFIVGWWAVIPAIFLLSAAALAMMNRAAYHRPPTGAAQP